MAEFPSYEWTLSPTADRMGRRFVGHAPRFLPRPDHLAEQAGSDPSVIGPDEAHDLYVTCRAIGGGAELT